MSLIFSLNFRITLMSYLITMIKMHWLILRYGLCIHKLTYNLIYIPKPVSNSDQEEEIEEVIKIKQ
jgi:hypothetical protein